MKELLGIPEHLTEVAMFPVAWTIGTDFAPAPRHPARSITYFDGYAWTYESGPSDPVRLADGPGTIAEIDIDAPPSMIWPVVTDINLSAAYSGEFQGAEWVEPDAPIGVGSVFVGTNHNDAFGEFKVPAFIDAYDEDVAFGWRTSDVDDPGARWRFDLQPNGTGTRLRYSMILGPGPSGLTVAIGQMPDKEDRIIHRRVRSQRTSMLQVLAGVKRTVEKQR